MRAAMNWNIRTGYISGENPWACLHHMRIKSRERFLQPAELSRFFAALSVESDDLIKDFIFLSLYTGARRTNVLGMRWEDINFDLALWRIPITKNGDSQTVPLTNSAMEVLKRRFDARTQDEWVFPGKGTGNHFVEPKRAWHRLLERAKIENLRIHDLRRTLGGYMAIGNTSLQIIGKALGHKSLAATEIYARLSAGPVRAAMEQAQNTILTAAGMRPVNTSNVIENMVIDFDYSNQESANNILNPVTS